LLGTFGAAAKGQVGAANPALVYTFGALSAFAVVLTAGYILWMFQRVYMGPQKPEYEHYHAVQPREYFVMATLGLSAVVFGVVPMLLFKMTDPTLQSIVQLIHP
jgi:NADH-quinone oxidoreductase subunit M